MLPRLALVCALGVISAGCGTINPVDTDGGSPDANVGFVLSVEPANVFFRQGEVVSVMVSVERDADNGDAIAITADALPEGVTAGTLSIASDEDMGMLELTAAADATQGAVAVSVVGEASSGTRMAALRLVVGGPPGTLDLSFASDGKFLTQIASENTEGRGVYVQADGKIVLIGASSTRLVIGRLLPDGTADPAFGTNGIAEAMVGDSSGGLAAVRLPDRRIAVAGWSGGAGAADNDYAVYMFDDQGVIDNAFGDMGHAINNPGADFAELHGVVRDSAGGLVVAGIQFSATPVSHFLRFSAQGNPDTAFGDFTLTGATVASIRIDVANNIVGVGGQAGDFAVLRLLADGNPDPSFNTTGQVVTDFSAGNESANSVVELPGGKLMVFGTSVPSGGGNPKVAMARYNANGTLDTTFNATGRRLTSVDLGVRSLDGLVRDADGRFVYVGNLPPLNTTPIFAVTRFLPNGDPDTSFAPGGVMMIDFGLGTNNRAGPYGVTLDADGRILVIGSAGPAAANQQIAIARIWP